MSLKLLRWGGFVLLLLFLVPAIVIVALEQPPAGAATPSEFALADIPDELLSVYRAAALESCEMPWEVLAAVGKIESDHGRSTMPGVSSGTNSAGAAGPMQFMPGTWAAYSVDGDDPPDGIKNIYSPKDAIWSAANYLCANGAGDGTEDRLRNALWHYNHSDVYVQDVLDLAAEYRAAGAGVGQGAGATALLSNPNLVLTPRARGDLEAGIIDQDLVDFLAWSVQRHKISVSVLKTGHSEFVAGTDRRSNHFFGRAVDIYSVDNQTVRDTCVPCRTYAEEIAALGAGRPDETGTPWRDMVGSPGFFSDLAHRGHIHAGWDS
jgi:hypothetical protein